VPEISFAASLERVPGVRHGLAVSQSKVDGGISCVRADPRVEIGGTRLIGMIAI
jgi:hypothetical protein